MSRLNPSRGELLLECIALGGWVIVGFVACAAHLIVWWLS